ncbi:Putative sporulation hydrolase CotR [Polaribacter huanghezhanensis]|uniref:patatin-like phospholipase family protein n=1 Tax=Polaribacter huanghezhanensis TaxID=1354726 RepID=UPI002648B233|nr:patatin-like phospholipase family protein [Polaribacter huanghezhanensis]WKD85231.1 Putative sporulation hydrolase CotR [Polaribacter huanghezhanensis]
MKKIRILSIDGGGIRGILPGIVLTQIEQKLQKRTGDPNVKLSDMFDFMAGTSTGGILALAYLTPNEENRPKLTAQEAVNIYLNRGNEIFNVSNWQKIKSGKGITDEKYNASELEGALDDTFEELKLSNLLKPCIISSYDIRNGKPHFFKQHKSNNEIYNFKIKDVARATSAAPTYFQTALIKNEIGTPYPLIDGGVFVNNPSLVAYSEVRSMNFENIENTPSAKNMMIVSIGTGSVSKGYEYKKAKDWGAIGWIKPIIEIMMSGNSKTVHYHLTQIFGTLEEQDQKDYHRLEPKIITADTEMDNASIENLQKLNEDGLSFVSIESIDKELDTIVEKLIKYQN